MVIPPNPITQPIQGENDQAINKSNQQCDWQDLKDESGPQDHGNKGQELTIEDKNHQDSISNESITNETNINTPTWLDQWQYASFSWVTDGLVAARSQWMRIPSWYIRYIQSGLEGAIAESTYQLEFKCLTTPPRLKTRLMIPVMRCVVCRDVQCTNKKIINFTLSAGCLLCSATLHTEVWLQVWRGFLVYWENSVIKSMPHTKCKIIKLETVGD